MEKKRLGNQGLQVPALGLGCMAMTGILGKIIYGEIDEQEAIATIHRSLELGGNFLDTADVYGPLENERLIAKAVKGNREKYILATKFGFEINEADQLTGKVNGSKKYVKAAAERSLKILGTDYIDLYYLHRLDFNTPIEETVDAMAELIKEGKIGYIGLSEVSSATIRRANAVHPITALQSEYSLFERSLEPDGLLDTLTELGIGLVAYSPLGRGVLTGAINSPDEFSADDARKNTGRYVGEHFYKNLERVAELQKIALEKGVTSAQLALAWVLAKGHIAIPGTKRRKYLEENIAATSIQLSPEDIARMDGVFPVGSAAGDRLEPGQLTLIDR